MRGLLSLLRWIHEDERGITGIETAGIATAFVVTGTVLSTVVVDTGTFSANQARDTIMQSIDRVRGNVDIRGSVIATSSDKTVKSIQFDITPSVGGRPIELGSEAEEQSLVVNVMTSTVRVSGAPYTVRWIAKGNGDSILDPGEVAEISVAVPIGSDEPCPCGLRANERFTVELFIPNGNTVTFERTIPAGLTPVMNLN